MKLVPRAPAGMLWLTAPYNEDFNNDIKQYPGVRWMKKEKRRLVPADLVEVVRGHARAHKMDVSFSASANLFANPGAVTLDERLYEYQADAAKLALHYPSMMLNFDPGLGKTPTAIAVLQSVSNALVICPANMRTVWQDELSKWLPEAQVFVIKKPSDYATVGGKTFHSESPIVLVCSYGTLRPDILVDMLILDESHYVKNPKSGRTKIVKQLRGLNPEARVLMLTATPIANDPADLWQQLDIMYPGRYGTFWQFTERYSNVSNNGYGRKVLGLNDERADELRERLKYVAISKSKAEVAHLLPPFTVQGIRVPRNTESSEAKVEAALEHVSACRENDEKHVMVLTYLRDTAQRVWSQLESMHENVFYVDGELSIDKREETLREARYRSRSIVVATIGSVMEGIDLTWNSTAIFAEMVYSPRQMVQVLGRFSRLSGTIPTRVLLLILEATNDEYVAAVILRKLTEANKVLTPGTDAEKMIKALVPDEDEEYFKNRLIQISEGGRADEYR